MAEKRSPALADWIADNVSFPGTMVDRIVPAATPESLAEIAAVLGSTIPAPSVANPSFSGWSKITLSPGAPPGTAGVQMTDDVLPREQMKLRMLNGSHSFLAAWLSGRACAH